MSRWSREQLRVALAPGGLALLRHRGNPAKPVASKTLACDTRDWQSLMPLLERELADPAWRASRVEVVLSNQFVRFVLTPPPGKALSKLEEEALVGASFRDIYGQETTSWRIRVLSQPPQFGLVGAAIDESLATQLGEIFKRQNYPDWSLNPLASLAAHRYSYGAADWWVLAEPGWLCLFNAVGGYWRYLSSQPVDNHWQSSLPDILNREARMTGSIDTGKPQTVFIEPVGTGSATPPASTAWNWRMTTSAHNVHGVLALAME